MHDRATQLQALLDSLERRHLVTDGLSRWGEPALRRVGAAHEPQRVMDASALQRRLVACAHATPSPGDDQCALWVERVFSRLGLGIVTGDAREIWQGYCHHTRTEDLLVGMVVAVRAHPFSAAGKVHGHVGLYVGDGMVMDAVGTEVRKVPLELWLSAYGLMGEPRWGWLGGIGLTGPDPL